MCENIFTQAAFVPRVWDLACRVIELYENGNLKLSKKCMIVKPEFKQHNFQCLHNLPPAFQQEVLEEVIDGIASLEDMKKNQINSEALHLSRKPLQNIRIPLGKRRLNDFPGTLMKRDFPAFWDLTL